MAAKRKARPVPVIDEASGEIAPPAVETAAPIAIRDRKSDNDVPQQERDFVGKLLSRIQRALDLRSSFEKTTLPRLRRLMWGSTAGTEESQVRANLIFSTIATMLPHVYAKNPEIGVTPTEAVRGAEYEKWKEFCKTQQAFLNRVFIEETGLKRRAKSNVRSAMGTSIGWMKMAFQERISTDPLMIKRQSDIQDDLQRIEALITQADDAERQQLESQKEEIAQRRAALEQSNEVRTFKGFNVDRVQTEDIIILDESIVDFDNYVDAEAIAHRVWMTDDDYQRNFGGKPLPGAATFDQPSVNDAADESGKKITFTPGTEGTTKYRAVFEVWDKTARRIYTVALGQAGYCCEPYTPEHAPQRWYPFYGLAFNLVEGRFRPLSDTELIEHLQAEYSTTRYLYAEARKEAIPTRVFRKSGDLTEGDIDKLKGRKAREWIGIEGNPQIPLVQEFLQLEGIKIDPAAYDVTLIRNDIDMMVGLSDASRANLIQAKTATEAEIMRQALMNRVAERQDTNEDLISDMATSALEISLQAFSRDEVAEVVGDGAKWREDFPVPDNSPEAEQQNAQAQLAWQQAAAAATQGGMEPPPVPEPVTKPMSIEAIFHRISAKVRVGSTGRPNQMKEREQWTQLMPVISETATKVAELRMQGAHDLANTQVELLRETLRRFDERLDIDALIPKQEMGEDGQPTGQGQQMAEMQQKLAQMERMNEELTACKEELEATKQALQKAQLAEETKIAEANAKAEESRGKSAVEQERERQKAEVEHARIEEEMANKRFEIVMNTAAQLFATMSAPQPQPAGEDGKPAAAKVEKPDFKALVKEIGEAAGMIS